VLGVSPGSYQDHFGLRVTPRQRKHMGKYALLAHIKAIHAEGKYD